jgi:hypothetical protein
MKSMASKSGTSKDEGGLYDHYVERQKQSRARNPTRSVGDDDKINKADKEKRDKR